MLNPHRCYLGIAVPNLHSPPGPGMYRISPALIPPGTSRMCVKLAISSECPIGLAFTVGEDGGVALDLCWAPSKADTTPSQAFFDWLESEELRTVLVEKARAFFALRFPN